MQIIDSFICEKSGNNLPEKFLYHIWDEQHIKFDNLTNKSFKSVSGKEIKIHFPGHYNTMSGADFKNALIEFDGKNLTGDVEIHLNTNDWYSHQHDDNPAYNTVILHVVLRHNRNENITINEKNDHIEILELQYIISDEIEKLFQKYEERDYLINEKYCGLFASIRPEFLEKMLIQSGVERLEKKIKRFEAELSFVSLDQLFYQSILEAMGYSKNKHQFYLFSKDNKWTTYKQKNLSLNDFTEDLITKADFDNNKYGWYLFRIRPCNHPKTRIYQIAPFIYKSFESSMASEITKLFSFTKGSLKLSLLKKRIYENMRYEGIEHKLGKDRIDTIVVNIFIPLLIIYSKILNDNELYTLCMKIYHEYNGLQENHISHIMKKYMTEEQYAVSESKAICQQGLLNIYHKYCINHLCKLCRCSFEL